MLSSGPFAMDVGKNGTGNSVIAPSGVMRPILLLLRSPNQIFPSGPTTIDGWLFAGSKNSLTTDPAGVIAPILGDVGSPLSGMPSVNQILPSGPAMIACG